MEGKKVEGCYHWSIVLRHLRVSPQSLIISHKTAVLIAVVVVVNRIKVPVTVTGHAGSFFFHSLFFFITVIICYFVHFSVCVCRCCLYNNDKVPQEN